MPSGPLTKSPSDSGVTAALAVTANKSAKPDKETVVVKAKAIERNCLSFFFVACFVNGIFSIRYLATADMPICLL